MKILFLAGWLSIYLAGFSTLPSLGLVRALHQKSASDEKACKELIELLSPYNEHNALLMGYKASATMMMAQYVFNPFTKFSYFKKGKQMLEKAIQVDSKNIELRFLRFSTQTNIPSFLGYDEHIDEDKTFLLNSLSFMTDTSLKEMIIPALVKSKYLTALEKQQLRSEEQPGISE